jgi:hypothetical protein
MKGEEKAPLFYLSADRVDLFGDGKIPARNTARIVRRQVDFGITPAESNVGVMIVSFGNLADPVDKGERFGKIIELKSFQKFVVRALPIVQLGELRCNLLSVKFFSLHSFAPQI